MENNENKNLNQIENTEETSFEDIIENAEHDNKKSKTKKKKPNSFVSFLKSRKAKRGAVATAIVVVFICIIFLLNIITGILVEKFPALQLDLTSNHTYELQPDTVEYLRQVDNDITIYALAKEDSFKNGLSASSGSQYVVQGYKLLKKMAASNDKIHLKFIELSSNPTFTNKYSNINWSSSSQYLILIDAGDDNYTALTLDECFTYDSETLSYYGTLEFTASTIEQAVVTGILDVTTADKVCIDFITGSGETEDGYSAMKNLLKQNAYDVKDVSLTTGTLREKAEIAVLYGPTVDLSENAANKIQKWIDNDGEYGKTLIYIPVDTQISTPNIDAIISEYGMKISDGIAYCLSSSYYINSPYTFLTDYDSDIYTATLKNSDIPTIVGNSRTVEITNQDNAVAMLKVDSSVGVLPFDVSSDEITSEKDLEKYMQESINLACVGSKTNEEDSKSNVAVFGSYYMFTSTFLNTTSFNNGNYIVNFCNTVTDRGDMGITIATAEANIPEIGTITDGTVNAMYAIFIVVVPVIILLIGLTVFIRRRNR